jgi:predicted type IV restriction endonuclease
LSASIESLTEALQKLIHKFAANKIHYLSKSYLEAQARVDLISPFFKALGWDMENEAGLSQHEREVIVERGETEGYPDYNFRVGGQTKFFVEAKAPSEPVAKRAQLVCQHLENMSGELRIGNGHVVVAFVAESRLDSRLRGNDWNMDSSPAVVLSTVRGPP